jgi:hypothetical protein
MGVSGCCRLLAGFLAGVRAVSARGSKVLCLVGRVWCRRYGRPGGSGGGGGRGDRRRVTGRLYGTRSSRGGNGAGSGRRLFSGQFGGRHDVDGGRLDVVVRLFGNFHHDDGDVVGRAGFQCEVHQRFHAFADVFGFPDCPFHDVAGYVVQAVGAEQPAFAGLHVQSVQVQFGAGVDVSENAHEDVLVRVGFGFLGAETALIDQALDERVVDADLFEFAVSEPVGPGITDVGEVQLAFREQQGRHGSAHAGKFGIDVDEFGQQRVCRLDFVSEDGSGVAVVLVRVQVDHVKDGGRGGDVTSGVPAHAVGHDGQMPAHVGGIIVFCADTADVGARGIAQNQRMRRDWCLLRGDVRSGHGYGLNSMTVLPILTGTPRSTGRARVSCWSAR